MLNLAKQLDIIPGFNNNLRYNFNHLMYADDLIIVTTTTRKSARNINLCLNIYHQLTGQKPNQLKYEIYFPNWFNERVSSCICSILNFNHGKILFKYLGVLISHKQIAISNFNSMIDNLNVVVANLVYPTPDTVLHRISQVTRKFLWANSDNGRGITMVNWSTITFSKIKGGMALETSLILSIL